MRTRRPLHHYVVPLPLERGRIQVEAGRDADSSAAKRGRGTMPPGLAFGKPEDRLRMVEGAD